MSSSPQINQVFSSFSECVSEERLERYRRNGDDDLETLTRYVWNTCLCESLYPALQMLEIGFRNSLHNAAQASFADPKWYKSHGLLTPSAQEILLKAENALTDRQKPLDAPRVVAELGFGFWTNLLNRNYEQALWPRLLKPTFPGMPARIRTRHNLFGRFDAIRKLRNRISHHEPILDRAASDNEHTMILETIGWIDPVMQKVVRTHDRFAKIHSGTHYNQIRVLLRELLT